MTRPVRRLCVAVLTAAVLTAGCGHADRDTGADVRHRAAGTPAAGATARADGDHPAPSPLGRSVPTRLKIGAIGVDTPVLGLGLAADGTVQVPPIEAHDQAGWYRDSPTPGQVGPAVILGHVTVGSFGDGVFRRLGELRHGDRVEVRRKNGTSAAFAVTSVRTVAKADFPSDDVYGDVDRPELRLITCGGPRSGDGYRDNVIVFATLSG
ncbi:class F sortase [Streptomyces sp. NPDC050560]|uniref:class F sortase n=1 Tax=Streptomyces sp. NPDC050560 TaxID=3365630 RepID=UPI0037B73A25